MGWMGGMGWREDYSIRLYHVCRALDPARFPHPEHVRLGYEMLGRYAFSEALARFARGLRLLAVRPGGRKFITGPSQSRFSG